MCMFYSMFVRTFRSNTNWVHNTVELINKTNATASFEYAHDYHINWYDAQWFIPVYGGEFYGFYDYDRWELSVFPRTIFYGKYAQFLLIVDLKHSK